MAWFQRSRKGWERIKAATHSVTPLETRMPLAGWANGDQMVYAVNPVFLEIGQGGISPMRGWGAIIFVGVLFLALAFLLVGVPASYSAWQEGEVSGWMFGAMLAMAALLLPLLAVPIAYFAINFFSVTDAIVRLDPKRQKVWLWTYKGPVEINWANLTPQVECSVATAYATVKTYRGQYVERSSDGRIRTSHGIPHAFQVGQVSAAEEGVRPSMEYVRRYMESGLHAVQQPDNLLSHRPRWYAMVNFAGMADDWVRWRENRASPGVAPAPWTRTIVFTLLFPLFFPLQFTNWLALAIAPRPKWPKELVAMHQADQAHCSNSNVTQNRHSRRKPVIRVNGELLDDDDS